MKTRILTTLIWAIPAFYATNTNAQANQALSNLTAPTAVNQHLQPNANNTLDLGTSTLGWRNFYLSGGLYLNGSLTMTGNGTDNFFVGRNAGNTTLTGSSNTAVGAAALNKITTGYFNAAVGSYSLAFNTGGAANTAIGHQSLFSNTTGHNNVASGYGALYLNTSGGYNTATGNGALRANQTGSFNTATGTNALYYSTGNSNVADGYNSLFYNTTGYGNTAGGTTSLSNNTTGYNNTASGANSLFNNTTGYNNTALGYGADVSTGNLSNATAIGNGAIVDASNKVRIGNSSVTSIGGQVGWTTFSDGRFKKDTKENVAGLAFINSLRPVTYTLNVNGLNEYYRKGRKQLAENTDAPIIKEADAAKIIHTGFVAQEVEEAARKLNYEFSGVDKPQSQDGLYGLRYENFVAPLVKAVQEFSAQNADLQKQINELKAMLTSHPKHNNPNPLSLTDASLEQNVPNPFNKTTTIGYNLPLKFTTAQILITDQNGKVLKQVNISGTGKGTLNLDSDILSSGGYNYSLLIDGKVISSKRMVLAR